MAICGEADKYGWSCCGSPEACVRKVGGINREPSPMWQNPYQTNPYRSEPVMSDLIETTMKNRMESMVDGLTRGSAFSRMLYADTIKWSNRPLSYRVKHHVKTAAGRVRDAWLVLTGKAEIGDWG
jgi:hypothetical protein